MRFIVIFLWKRENDILKNHYIMITLQKQIFTKKITKYIIYYVGKYLKKDEFYEDTKENNYHFNIDIFNS